MSYRTIKVSSVHYQMGVERAKKTREKSVEEYVESLIQKDYNGK